MTTPNRNQLVRPNNTPTARWQLREWAIQKVEGFVDQEAAKISSKEGGFYLTKKQTTWDFIQKFTLANVASTLEGPVLLRLLVAMAIPIEDHHRSLPLCW